MSLDHHKKRQLIMKNYAAVAARGSAGACCSGSCGCSPGDARAAALAIGYSETDLTAVPDTANMGLGCGNPLALAALKPGETVLDLGSGGGFDCFLSARQVGPQGRVIGVDMTPEMIHLARQNAEKAGLANVSFRLGEIEHLPVADASVDVILSNCVINLALDKAQVIDEAYRVLRPGGRLSVSDVVALAPLPDPIKEDLALLSGCISGAETIANLQQMLERTGFTDIRIQIKADSRAIIQSWQPDSNVADFVASAIIEAVKPL
jgi:SAM-dependent methyltransferase